MAQLESLANELLLDLFEFLGAAHIFQAFFGLNSRFNLLLYTHLRVQLNFQSISKEHFDTICQQYLPTIIDQISSLRLSDEETPNLFELLVARGFTLNRFVHLQSLSLHNIQSVDKLIKITSQCLYLSHLTHLTIINCDIRKRQGDICGLLNNIWAIQKLTHCNLNDIQSELTNFPQTLPMSSSIEYLSIQNIRCDLQRLTHLFKCTPRLSRLCASIRSPSMNNYLDCIVPSLISLRLSFEGPLNSMIHLFRKMPKLSYLRIETSGTYLDGNEWEKIIKNDLPKIKVFRLKMNCRFTDEENKQEEQVDRILNTFRSTFWIEEHQWFVRCHWDPWHPEKLITLYTLPYAFSTISNPHSCCAKSTCLDDEDYQSYDHVQSLDYTNVKDMSSYKYRFLNPRFPNIHHLVINSPFDEKFWLHFSSLYHLASLDVFLCTYFSYCQLQTLIDRTPFLYSLKLRAFPKFRMGLPHLKSKSIRLLDLMGAPTNKWNHYFTEEDCFTVINSSLGLQCEVLLIRLNNRNNILALIQNMSNLRSLIFQCEEDNQLSRFSPDPHYKLLGWLQNYFPSSYSITRDLESFYIRVWIDREEKLLLPNNYIVTHKLKNTVDRRRKPRK